MTEQRVSSRYAKALITAAIEEKILEQVLNDLRLVKETINSSKELARLTKSPVVQYWKKKKIYAEIFENKISKLAYHFILLLTEKHREPMIIDIIKEYENQYNKEMNLLPLQVFTARELNDDLSKKICTQLETWTKKTIIPDFQVDAKIKGGIQVKIDDWVFDASLKNQLDILYKNLVEGSN